MRIEIARLLCAVFPFVVAVAPGEVAAQSVDPHAFFEENCSQCHGTHAAAFTRKSMILDANGRVFGVETRESIEDYLFRHRGGYPGPAIAALVDMFSRQLKSGGVFAKKCRACHKRAVTLARRTLIVSDGKLVGRYTGRDMAEFLSDHGRLKPQESATMLDVLRWHLETEVR